MTREEKIRRIELLTDAAFRCLDNGKHDMALIWLRHARRLGDTL